MSSDNAHESSYEAIGPQYGPFHPAAYPRLTTLTPSPIINENISEAPGFPRRPAPIRNWVPGVSTPEGIILASAAAVAAAETFGVTGELLFKAVNGFAALVLTTTVVGIPAGALWIGDQIMGK